MNDTNSGANASSTYDQTVSDIRPGVRYSGRLLVRESNLRKSANGKAFVDLRLCDRTGIVPAKIWDPPKDKAVPPPGLVFKVTGKGDEYNGHIQLKIDSITPAPDADPAEFVIAAPESPESMLAEIRATAAELRDESLMRITLKLLEYAEATGRLSTAPAAKSMHHAERGGLLHHTVMMLRAAKAFCTVYKFLDKDLLYAGVIAHDLGKIDEMESDSLGAVDSYSRDGRLVGHIVRGVTTIERAAAETNASREKTTLLQHMVLSHHGVPEFGSPVPPKFPEALVLSTIDRLDAHLFAMHDALKNVKPGEFSEPVFALDRTELYKPSHRPDARA